VSDDYAGNQPHELVFAFHGRGWKGIINCEATHRPCASASFDCLLEAFVLCRS
jgi:hypothetical protein